MKSFSITDIGMYRKMNQDYCYASDTPVGDLPSLYIVADGMGGHNAGEYASRYTVDVMVEKAKAASYADPKTVLKEAIEEANAKLLREAAKNSSMWGMGTTVVAAVISEDQICVANVGDSRLYIIDHRMRQITQDHSYVEELVRRGEIDREAARNHPDKNIITRAVGVTREVEIDFFEEYLHPGNKVLLCSDGLTNMLEDDRMHDIITGYEEPARAAVELAAAANQNGGKDNITVIVVDPFSR